MHEYQYSLSRDRSQPSAASPLNKI
jgi:hypothetical protein